MHRTCTTHGGDDKYRISVLKTEANGLVGRRSYWWKWAVSRSGPMAVDVRANRKMGEAW